MTDNNALAQFEEGFSFGWPAKDRGWIDYEAALADAKKHAELRTPAPAPVGGKPVAWMYDHPDGSRILLREKLHRDGVPHSKTGWTETPLVPLQAQPAPQGDVVEALRKAEKTFRWYGDLHAAKPDHDKAKRNYDLADEMLAALRTNAHLKGEAHDA